MIVLQMCQKLFVLSVQFLGLFLLLKSLLSLFHVHDFFPLFSLCASILACGNNNNNNNNNNNLTQEEFSKILDRAEFPVHFTAPVLEKWWKGAGKCTVNCALSFLRKHDVPRENAGKVQEWLSALHQEI